MTHSALPARAYQSWGRLPTSGQAGLVLESASVPERPGRITMLPFGRGLSYGDSCLNHGGLLLDTHRLSRILSFDPASGRLRAEAGVSLGEIIERVLPQGWFPPVTPGTKHVTLGGAIANDVHGKNHHRRGTFGRHVLSLVLARSSGERLVCSQGENAHLFAATIGGLGLTGLIAEAEIQLARVGSNLIEQETIRFGRLDEFLDLAAESDARFEHSVAWIDQLARGGGLGRGLFIRGNHVASGPLAPLSSRARLRIGVQPPVSLIGRLTLSAFNSLYWRRQRMGIARATVPYEPFFYPLDRIGQWNRLYGPRGLLQHQSVVPLAAGRDAVAEMIRTSQKAGQASFLTVLKVFGDLVSPGLLSFPRPGITLTLDYANTGDRVLRLLDDLDRIVIAAGGAVNPYKDARMPPATFAASFPRWAELERLRDPAFSSSFWRRATGLGATHAS